MFLCMLCQCQVKKVGWLRLSLLIIVTHAMTLQAAAQAEGKPPCIFSEELPDFTENAYSKALSSTVAAFEKENQCKLAPQKLGKVALKVYTSSGINLCTPHALVNAMIELLINRGFKESCIYVVDGTEHGLINCHFLGTDSRINRKVNVLAFENGEWSDKAWFYDCALPSEVLNRFIKGPIIPECQGEEGRKSYLPRILMEGVDFWINMPVEIDHKILGVNGAMVNASLGIASNTLRFYGSELTGPAVVAEILAIPEVHEKMILTVVSLENYQYVGGPVYNAMYTAHEHALWVSGSPIRIDYEIWLKMNQLRLKNRMAAIRIPTMFKYARVLEATE